MVQVVVDLTEKANKVAGIIKATYGLRSKAEAVDLIVEKCGEGLIEPGLRPEYVARVKKAQKGQFIRVKDVDKYFKEMLK
ncbi:DUF2683 family protein [Candidatus Micrarchaeota archaeon]|nr:DUF2683 family protein [Candidatus Micrarchaeota archaeon]